MAVKDKTKEEAASEEVERLSLALRKLEGELERLEPAGPMAKGIAHDFNNILHGIVGKASVVKARLGPGDKLFERLTDIEGAAERAKSTIKRLLNLSREAGLLKEAVSVADLLRDTARLVFKGSGVEYGCIFEDGLFDVSIDPAQVGSAMNNIILNAAEAFGEGGVVEIGAGNVTVSGSDDIPLEDGPYVRITVKDSGAGIPEEELPKIFEAFYTTKEKASGLGLALAYSVIKKHGGHIGVEPAEGGGTLFSIYLPAR
jgi:signal transduction histidine kinase